MKNIKVCIAGLSASGKSTLLNSLRQKLPHFEVIDGSSKLCEFANISKDELKKYNEHEKDKLRKQFLDYLCNLQHNTVVGGHYSFLKDKYKDECDKFEIAMKEDIRSRAYNLVLFLDTDIKVIQERLKQRDKKNITLELLQEWSKFELDGLEKECKEYNVHFSAIKFDADSDANEIADFINFFIQNSEYIEPRKIFEYFMYENGQNLKNKIILSDCDGTLSNKDSVKEFYKIKEVQNYKIPNVFHDHRFYGMYQFFRLTQKRLEIDECTFKMASKKASDSIHIHPNFVNTFKSTNASLIAITSGIREIWKNVFYRSNLPFIVVANDRCTIISRDTKAYFAKELTRLGFDVIALGDEIVDIDMLEYATQPILIESSKEKIFHFLSENTQKKLITCNPNHSTDFIQAYTMVYELKNKYPLQNFINQTRISKTNSKDLCKIHIDFGTMLGREILGTQKEIEKQENLTQGHSSNLSYHNENDFIIISILRAGLYIGLGLREVFSSAPFYIVKEPNELRESLFKESLCDKKIIIADAVINTGKTIKRFLEALKAYNTKIYIATNVIYKPTVKDILQNYPNIYIFTIRTSENSYQGRGNNDTGNRLFGLSNTY